MIGAVVVAKCVRRGEGAASKSTCQWSFGWSALKSVRTSMSETVGGPFGSQPLVAGSVGTPSSVKPIKRAATD